MTKVLAAALVAVIAIDRISFDNALYEPGSKLEGLTDDQAQGLVANGHAKPVTGKAAAPVALDAAGEGAGADDKPVLVAPLVKAALIEAAVKPAAAKPAAAKTTAKK